MLMLLFSAIIFWGDGGLQSSKKHRKKFLWLYSAKCNIEL